MTYSTDTTLNQIQKAMCRLGFTMAAATIEMRWWSYSFHEKRQIAQKWGVQL